MFDWLFPRRTALLKVLMEDRTPMWTSETRPVEATDSAAREALETQIEAIDDEIENLKRRVSFLERSRSRAWDDYQSILKNLDAVNAKIEARQDSKNSLRRIADGLA